MSDAQEKIDEAVQRASKSSDAVGLAVRDCVPQIQRRLPPFLPAGTAERFAAVALSTIQATQALRDCTPKSIVRGVITAAGYGLAVDGVLGHAYLVPYKIRGVPTAQFQIGYRGLVELMLRTGLYTSVHADVVFEADTFDHEWGTSPRLRHVRALKGERGERFAAYAIVHPTEGVPTFVVLSEADVLRHRDCSKAYQFKPNESIWKLHPDVAWRKSAVRELSKNVALATDHHKSIRGAAIIDEKIDSGEVVDVEGEEVESEEASGG